MKGKIAVWLCLGLIGSVVLAGGVVAQGALDRAADASGNGHDWTEAFGADIRNVTGPVEKFGGGIEINDSAPAETSFFTEDVDELVGETDLSFTLAFQINHSQAVGDTEVFLARDDSLQDVYEIEVSPSGVVSFTYDAGGAGQVSCSLGPYDEGQFISLWGSLDRGGVLSNTDVFLEGYNETGAMIGTTSCTDPAEPSSSGVLDNATLGNDLTLANDPYLGQIYEFRWWDQELPSSTLQAIADPSDSSFKLQGEGSEVGLWFLEQILQGDAVASMEARVAIHAENGVDAGESFQIQAFAFNRTAWPVELVGEMQFSVTRVVEAGPEWLNVGTGAWVSQPVLNDMVQMGTSPATWEATWEFPGGTDGPVVVAAFGEITAPGDAGNLNVTGTHQVEVSGSGLVTQSHETDLFQVTRLTPFELALFPGMAFVGVVLWSRTKDTVVRVFGAVLPMAAGILLISFGNAEGFGNLWSGTVAFAIAHVLLGIYMIVREFYDLLAERDEGEEGMSV